MVALQEARMLFPHRKIDCLVSIGNGLPFEIIKEKETTAFEKLLDLSKSQFSLGFKEIIYKASELYCEYFAYTYQSTKTGFQGI